ACSAG
uniref:Antimicrobial peptide OEP3121 n=1 Tax=Eisenia fetida TaxID=6396 RepID=AP21_EISFE